MSKTAMPADPSSPSRSRTLELAKAIVEDGEMDLAMGSAQQNIQAICRELIATSETRPSRDAFDTEWLLSNAMWRMFNHGKEDRTVSAQCEVQALGMFLHGEDVPAWKTSVVEE